MILILFPHQFWVGCLIKDCVLLQLLIVHVAFSSKVLYDMDITKLVNLMHPNLSDCKGHNFSSSDNYSSILNEILGRSKRKCLILNIRLRIRFLFVTIYCDKKFFVFDSTRNPRLDQKWSTLDQKWSNPKSQVGPDLVHPGPLLVQPQNA